jgi:K+-transporting ATPase ATPase A chain
VSGQGGAQLVVYAVVLLAVALPLGLWMARVYGRFHAPGVLGSVERGFYRLVRVDPGEEQDWRAYAGSVLVFSIAGTALLYAIVRLQQHLPGNPDGFGTMPAHLSLNTSLSFVTNTSW